MPRKPAANKSTPAPETPKVVPTPTPAPAETPAVAAPLVSFYRLRKYTSDLFEIQEVQVPADSPDIKSISKKDTARLLIDRIGQYAYDESKRSRN